jgi:hypothetical protein
MKIRRTADRNTAQIVNNDVRSGSPNIVPLRATPGEKTRQDPSLLKLRPALQAVALTHDLIAERARTIWMKRGCSRNQDEENWRNAEAQLKTELGIG